MKRDNWTLFPFLESVAKGSDSLFTEELVFPYLLERRNYVFE